LTSKFSQIPPFDRCSKIIRCKETTFFAKNSLQLHLFVYFPVICWWFDYPAATKLTQYTPHEGVMNSCFVLWKKSHLYFPDCYVSKFLCSQDSPKRVRVAFGWRTCRHKYNQARVPLPPPLFGVTGTLCFCGAFYFVFFVYFIYVAFCKN